MSAFLALVAAFIAWFLAYWFLGLIGLGFGLTAWVMSLVIAVVVFVIAKGKVGSAHAKLPAGFISSFSHDNIAIDQQNGKLWLRDASGHQTVVDKGDLLRWNVAYVAQGAVHFNNKLEIHVRDLTRPKIDVHFRRHRDANRNFADAEEWQSRLTTWVNNY